MSCPDLLMLSQLLDAEAVAGEPVRAHLEGCSSCAARLARVRAAEMAAHGAAHAIEPVTTPSLGCLTPSQIVVWLEQATEGGERHAMGRHLEACNHCLGEALAADRLTTRLVATPSPPVPSALKARVASRWPVGSPAPSLTTLVVALTRRAAELVERHLVAPVQLVTEITPPAFASRASGDVATLQFELRTDGARIRTTVVPTSDAVNVTIALADDEGEPLSSQRVSLQRHGRAMFSARTDAAGEIALPALERGVYEVSCPSVATTFRLDLRTTADAG